MRTSIAVTQCQAYLVSRISDETLLGRPARGNGGARRNRTADLVNAIHALSQLSYGPMLGNGCLRAAPALSAAAADPEKV